MIPSRAALAITGISFAGLVGIAHFDPDDFGRADALARQAALPLQQFPTVEPFLALTAFGSTTGIALLALLAVVLGRRDRVFVLGLLIALMGTSASVWTVKQVIARARPEALDWLGALHTYSFPSGHAASAMALFGFLAVIAARRLAGLPRALAVAGFAALIVGIGASRIVLAEHFGSDVLAGYLLGAFWIALALLLTSPAPPAAKNAVHLSHVD